MQICNSPSKEEKMKYYWKIIFFNPSEKNPKVVFSCNANELDVAYNFAQFAGNHLVVQYSCEEEDTINLLGVNR